MKKDWQKDIHDRMGNYEMDAPEGLWEGITKGMAERKPASNPVKAPRLSLSRTLFRAAGAAAVACIALLSGFFFLTNEGNNGNIEAPIASVAAPTTASSIDQSAPITASAAPVSTSVTSSGRPCVRCVTGGYNRLVTPVSSTSPTDMSKDEKQSSAPETSSSTSSTSDDRRVTSRYKQKIHPETPSGSSYIANATPQSSSRWTIGTGASGSMGSSTATRSMAEVFLAMGDGGCSWEDNPMLGIAVFNQGKEVKTEYKHHLPVRFGLNAAYQLTNRLAIESGLTYTRLSSDMSEGTNENRVTGSQQLDYVGIPLNMRYKALAYRPFSLYMSAGLLAEQCVSGHHTKDYIISGKSRKTDKETITTKPLQMSVNASIGLQLDILHNIGIYAEPGISYYFDDKSSLNTIYKEKNLNFNLNVGLRYTLEGK